MTSDAFTEDSMDRTAATSQSSSGTRAMFSRTSGLMAGAADVELKTRVSFEEAESFRRLARELGFGSTSDLLRKMVQLRLHGVDGVAMMERQRLEAVAGIGPQSALVGATR